MSNVTPLPNIQRTPWMIGAQGEVIDLLHPWDTQIHVATIAHALSHINRWCGHTELPYSVALHSLHVSQLCEKMGGVQAAYAGLLHDAHEAYLGDMPSPIKVILGDPWEDLELMWEAHVQHSLAVPEYDTHPADMIALATEKKALLPRETPAGYQWLDLPAADPSWHPAVFARRCTPREVEYAFLQRYEALVLMGGRVDEN